MLEPERLSELQVQVVWLKTANALPRTSLPDQNADAFRLLRTMGDTVRALKERYPNLKQVFLSSRIYAGYADSLLNPEPYAYESGFAVKWLIEAQIRQMEDGEIDPLAGNLDYTTVAPWLSWGPYMWTNGDQPRADGLVWLPEDFTSDRVHPGELGVRKVADMLLDFFMLSRFTSCWFLAGSQCISENPGTETFDPQFLCTEQKVNEPCII